MKPVPITGPLRLRLLARPGCELCQEMLEHLAAHLAGTEFDLEVLDVDSNPLWKRRYGLKIPVLLDDQGEVLCMSFFEPDALDRMRAERLRTDSRACSPQK